MEEDNLFLAIENLQPRIYGVNFAEEINWQIRTGEQWAIVGTNGSGKTMLADLITGKYAVKKGVIRYAFWNERKALLTQKEYPTELIRKVCFESAYLLADYKNMYYQQRFHALENELAPTVEDVLNKIPYPEADLLVLCKRLKLESLLKKHLIMLSSGELRRFLIATILMQKPELIIFDNPFIGLDKKMREQMDLFFSELAKFQQMIFLVPAVNEIPTAVTHVLPVRNFVYGSPQKKNHFLSGDLMWLLPDKKEDDFSFPIESNNNIDSEMILEMKDINISYSNRIVFRNLNWTIKKGEKWALLGPNGAGKSTLLSLIVGDNPKAYSQNIRIFGRRRGTGESIWEIKKPIGYISSEMHLYFQENQPCIRIVGSGFFDTIGLFRQCNGEQEQICLQWMELLGIGYLAEKSFLKISGGEQRLVLFARTLVKNPELLILDEPFHGLDMRYKNRARRIIEHFCAQEGRTLIYVTHRKEEIPSCVDHFLELEKI